MSNRKRRQISGQPKVEIIKRHFLDGVPVSALCEGYQIQPAQFYQWQHQLFENGEKAFDRKSNSPARSQAAEKRKLAKLEAKLV